MYLGYEDPLSCALTVRTPCRNVLYSVFDLSRLRAIVFALCDLVFALCDLVFALCDLVFALLDSLGTTRHSLLLYVIRIRTT